MISILLPTTGRCARATACLAGLHDSIRNRADWEIVSPIDADERTRESFAQTAYERKFADRLRIDYSPTLRGSTAAWNDGLKLAKGDYIVLAADDLVFERGWLDEAMVVMLTAFDSVGGLVSFNDSHWDGNKLGTHYLLSRPFIEQYLGGRIAWPCYTHSFHDMEANHRAKRARRYAWAERAHVRHEHWFFGDRQQDATDQRGLIGYEASKLAYETRTRMGFPDNYPPVIGEPRETKTTGLRVLARGGVPTK
jgi:glycosyltransferase involved in cell wall biosynthesis